MLVPNLHHPAVVKLRETIQSARDFVRYVLTDFERVSNIYDLRLMLASSLAIDQSLDLVSVVQIVFAHLLDVFECIYGAADDVFHSGTWQSEVDVTSDTMRMWANEARAASPIVKVNDVANGMQKLKDERSLMTQRVIQMLVGIDATDEEKLVFGSMGPSDKVTEVTELLVGMTQSDRYDFLRPKLLYSVVVNTAVAKGWARLGPNRALEPVEPCPMTTTDALRTLPVEELAVYFVTFKDKFRSWNSAVCSKHDANVEKYRERVQKLFADKKKNGTVAAVADWVEEDRVEDGLEAQIRELTAQLAAKDTQIATQNLQLVGLLGRVTASPEPSVGDHTATAMLAQKVQRLEALVDAESPRLSADELEGLRHLLADDVGEGATDDDVLARAKSFGLSALL